MGREVVLELLARQILRIAARTLRSLLAPHEGLEILQAVEGTRVQEDEVKKSLREGIGLGAQGVAKLGPFAVRLAPGGLVELLRCGDQVLEQVTILLRQAVRVE